MFIFRPVHSAAMSTSRICYNCRQPSVSIEDSTSHCCLANNKESFCHGADEPSLVESSLNKNQTSLCTPKVFSTSMPSDCTFSRVPLHLSKREDVLVSTARFVPRYSPYQISYHHSRRGSLLKTVVGIPRQ